MFLITSKCIEDPLNPYAIGMCGGKPGLITLSTSVATKAIISDALTHWKLKPSLIASHILTDISSKELSRHKFPYIRFSLMEHSMVCTCEA